MKIRTRILLIGLLSICMILFSQIAYLWEFEPYFFDLGNFIDGSLTFFHAIIILLFAFKSNERFESEGERLKLESKQRKLAFVLLFIDAVMVISYYLIVYEF